MHNSVQLAANCLPCSMFVTALMLGCCRYIVGHQAGAKGAGSSGMPSRTQQLFVKTHCRALDQASSALLLQSQVCKSVSHCPTIMVLTWFMIYDIMVMILYICDI